MSTDLVPMERVTFGGGRPPLTPPAVLAVEPLPKNTLDPRYPFCLDHRTACTCREAELAEQIGEYRYDLNAVRKAALDVLVGHRLFHYLERGEPGGDDSMCVMRGDGPLACQCTGCRLVRLADIPGLIGCTDDNGIVLSEDEHDARLRAWGVRR